MQTNPRSFRCSLLLSLSALAVLILSGCARVTPDNVQKIQKGMSPAQVESILGSPTDQDTKSALSLSTTTYHYKTTNGEVTIGFLNNQVWVIDADFNKQ